MSAEAVAGEDEDLGAVGQSVEARRGQEWIAEEVRPLGGRTVAGQQEAALLVALVDDIVEVFWRRGLERLETKVVQKEQVRAQV